MQTHILTLKVPLGSLNPGKLNSSSRTAKSGPWTSNMGRCWVVSWHSCRPERLQVKAKWNNSLIWIEWDFAYKKMKGIFHGKISPQTKDVCGLSCDSFLPYILPSQWPARTTQFILTIFCLLNWKTILKKLLADWVYCSCFRLTYCQM